MGHEPRLLRTATLIPLELWLLFSSAGILLASNQFTAVDGAMRCLSVYWHRPPYLGPNNHLLYPLNVWMWWRLAQAIGVRADGPATFLHLVAAMNAICAGGAVAVVHMLVWRFTQGWKTSLLAALVYGLSWVLLAHATTSAEPMVGLLVSLFAVLATAAGLRRDRLTPLFIGGVCLALALANYESMFLVAPLLYSLCLIWPGKEGASDCTLPIRRSILRLLIIMLGTVAGVVTIYGSAYYSLGTTTVNEMLRAFLQFGGEPEVYAGFRISKLANLPLGLIDNSIAVLPSDYQGLRWLLSTQKIVSVAALVGIFALVAIALILFARSVGPLCQSRRAKVFGLACAIDLLFELFPLLYWDPMYGKLWLQPLALMVILGGVLAGRMDAASAHRCGGVVVVIIALEVCINLPRVVFAHIEPTRCLDDASKAAELIGSHDKVVTDFDPVSLLWMALYDNEPSRTLLFPATPASASLTRLDRWTWECKRSGCRIMFVALLEQPRDVWDAFLEKRLKVHYGTFDRYRHSSQSIERFSCENGSLRVYEPATIQMEVH